MASFGARDYKLKCTQSRKNGKCMLQGYELKNIPVELLDPFGNLEGNELPQYVSMLTKLNLADNEISVIPDGIEGMGAELAQFEIRNNKLKCLPSSMSGLVGLKVIDASNNEIDQVEELDLPQLADLNLSKNLLSKLSNFGRGNLNSLSRLTLSNNKLVVLPDTIGALPNLRHLIVDYNKIASLPNFTKGNKIETISISYNQLTSLPQGLESCHSLTSLDVSTNKLTQWPNLPKPHDKGGLINLILNNNKIPAIDGENLLLVRHSLSNFQLSNCGLLTCPPEFGALRSLKTLNIEGNELKDIPGSLGYLPELGALLTVGNPIRRKNLDHPNCKELLKYLRTKDDIHPLLKQDLEGASASSSGGGTGIVGKKLREAAHYGTLSLVSSKVKDDQLSSMPSQVFEDPLASSLTELIITGHAQLLSFPSHLLHSLNKLMHLDLSNNGFLKSKAGGGGGASTEAVMPFLVGVSSLKTLLSLKLRNLSLTNKHFDGLSGSDMKVNGIGCRLKEFDIGQNQLTTLPLTFILNCPCLEIFVADSNSIGGIENDVPLFQSLKALVTVDLSNNKLTNVGQLVYMPTLQILNLESNLIKSIPPETALLPKLKSLLIGQNSIRSIPGDVISGGHTKLMSFLKNRLPKDYKDPDWVQALKNDGKPAGDQSGGLSISGGEGEQAEEVLDPAAQLTGALNSLKIEIAAIEAQLETSMSAATKHATKKKLQIKRAEKGRIERQMKS